MKVIARSLVVIFVALIAVPALAVTQTITTAVQLLAATIALMMGGTGTPLADTTPVENALVGAALLHPDYRSVDPDDPNDPNDSFSDYTELPSTDPNSVYILVHTERLPILMIFDGVVPEPILAGLDPVLRWSVDLGYDRTTPANVPTPFTLLPTFNPITAAADLPGAIVAGIDAATSAPVVPVAAPLQSKDLTSARAEQNNEAIIEKGPSPDGTRPGPIRQLLRGPVKFDPPTLPNTLRPNGDGPLKRIVNALTGQRPEPAADAGAGEEQPERESGTPE